MGRTAPAAIRARLCPMACTHFAGIKTFCIVCSPLTQTDSQAPKDQSAHQHVQSTAIDVGHHRGIVYLFRDMMTPH